MCICIAYIPPSDSPYFRNLDIGYFEQLEHYIRKYNDLYKMCAIGDQNARTADRNDFIDSSSLFDKYVQTLDQNMEECPFSIIGKMKIAFETLLD